MRNFLILTALLMTQNAFACNLFIAESEISKAIALQPWNASARCGGANPCVCMDGIAVYSNGVLSNDPVKRAAKILRQQQEEDAAAVEVSARRTQRARLKVLRAKGVSITDPERTEAVDLLIQLFGG